MHTNEFCNSERITSLVKHHIPAAKKSGQHENELSYTLPLQNVDKFSDLFSDMDHQTNLGLINYGVTMTTLEDVFLRLEGNENIKEEDYGILHGGEAAGKDETEQDQLLLSDTGKVTVKGTELWRQQVYAIARMHFLNLKRESKIWGTLLLLTGVMLAPYIIEFTTYSAWLSLQYEEIRPGLYFEPGKQFFKWTSGLLCWFTKHKLKKEEQKMGGKIDNFIQALKSQNILMDVTSGNIVSDQLVHNGAIKVDLENKKYRFTLMCHMEITNCYPVLVNIISNAFLHMFNSTARLRTWSHILTGVSVPEEYQMKGFFAGRKQQGNIPFYEDMPTLYFHVASANDSTNKDSLPAADCRTFSFCLLVWTSSGGYVPELHSHSFSSLAIVYKNRSCKSSVYTQLDFLLGYAAFVHNKYHDKFNYHALHKIPLLRDFYTDEQQVSDQTQLFISTFMEYKHGEACSSSCFKKKKEEKKVATRNVSFCVKKGLIGMNNILNSASIYVEVIFVVLKVYIHVVQIKGADGAVAEENAALGYCPQENALWSNLTMKEHLETFAAIKGIRKDDATMAINRISQALELRGHFKKTKKTLAAGLTRKLCFALSMLGNPTLMLLDEPTTGLDPKGKRQVWGGGERRAIHTMLQEKDEGVILTTHHMEEAEVLCDRVAIMVSGQLSKLGKNYLLQIKVKGVEQGDLVNTQILNIFPQAARQERISTLLAYKIPMEDALPLSRAFAMLEDAKQHFSLEEYSFSLNTLEQVFLELCKEHERDYFESDLKPAFDSILCDMTWKNSEKISRDCWLFQLIKQLKVDAPLQIRSIINFNIMTTQSLETLVEDYGQIDGFIMQLSNNKLYHADRVRAKKKLVSTDCCTLVEKYNSEMEDENAEFPGKCQAATFTSELFCSLVLFSIILLSVFVILYEDADEIPHAFLGKPSLNITEVKLLFAPNTKMSREIMKKIEMLSPLKGINMKVVEDEKAMEDETAMMASVQEFYLDIIGVVFQDEISYRLRFPTYRTDISPQKIKMRQSKFLFSPNSLCVIIPSQQTKDNFGWLATVRQVPEKSLKLVKSKIRVSTFPQFIVKIQSTGLKALSHYNLASTAHLLKLILYHYYFEKLLSINQQVCTQRADLFHLGLWALFFDDSGLQFPELTPRVSPHFVGPSRTKPHHERLSKGEKPNSGEQSKFLLHRHDVTSPEVLGCNIPILQVPEEVSEVGKKQNTCFNFSSIYCENPKYWTQGFVSLQSSIDSALIERITNHSVWEEMTSINGIRMKSPSITIGFELAVSVFLWTLSLCFAPFMYFLALTLSREKRKLKEDKDLQYWSEEKVLQAFEKPWLIGSNEVYSWLTSSSRDCTNWQFLLSQICLCFMLSSLLKKPRTTSFVIFIFIFCLGALNIATAIRLIPPSLELILSIFCPFAFGAGLSKVLYFQKYGRTFDFTDLLFEPYGYCLLIDSVLYMLLAFYFDKVVPGKNITKTYWCKSKNPYTGDAPMSELSHRNIFSDNAEPVPSEFDGKEAIRLNNIKKIYKMKNTETEALK
ncbi:ATP-binding cassette sub-family A member 8-A, partial [Ophiophagus hannah]